MGNISKIIGNLEVAFVAFVRGDGTFFKMAAGQIYCYNNIEQNNLVQRQTANLMIHTY